MRTKLDAGKIATAAGTAMIITAGNRMNPLAAIEKGERATFFRPSDHPVKGYKTWIAGHLEPAGRLVIDAGAEAALRSGKSLLPAGVRAVEGSFARGDTVAIFGPAGFEVARGLVAYDAADAVRIAGLKSSAIAGELGHEARAAMVHRDDLVMSRLGPLPGAAARVDAED
jgi:glutamate 5-kinase